MATAELGFIHRFEAGDDAARPPLLLLHGTGGSEDDLIPFARSAAPGAALLSPRGRVREGDMARFFRNSRPDVVCRVLAHSSPAFGVLDGAGWVYYLPSMG